MRFQLLGFRFLRPLRYAVAGAALVSSVSAGVACRREPAARPAPPAPIDVVLITIDTLRADRVGVTGGPAGLTPAIDALGKAGAVFLDATAHAPLTLPSHASILTGRYPPGHGIHDNSGFVLPSSLPTLATVCHDAGYRTGAFVSSFVLRRSTGLARGFDVYDDEFVQSGRVHVTAAELERRGSETARRAADWLAHASAGPYLLWVHLNDPHAPYDPPPAFAAKFPGRPYDGEVAASDFAVSAIVAAIPTARRSRTLIVITGDHGESLGEHGEPEHGVLVYDSTLHVPLVIAGPAVPAGRVIRSQVRHVDLLPTIAVLAGLPAPPGGDGESLVAAIDGAKREGALSYAESRFGELHFGWHALRAARDGTWKYIDGAAPELYQVSTDRAEQHDLGSSRAETVAGLSRALARLAGTRSAGQASTAVDAEATERLRSLGYVSGRVDLHDDRRAGPSGPAADPRAEIHRYVEYVTAFNRAMTDLDEGRQAAAENGFRRLAHEYPRAYEAHQYLARALAARRAYAAAAAEFDLALALGPREAEVYFDAARALADAGRLGEAFDRVERGRRLDPASPYGAVAEGLVARAAGQPDRAARAFADAVALNPKLASAHLELGRLAEARGDRPAARQEYERALDGDATLVEARRALERVSR